MPASIRRTIKKWRCHVSNGQNGQQSRMWLVVVVLTVAVGEETAVVVDVATPPIMTAFVAVAPTVPAGCPSHSRAECRAEQQHTKPAWRGAEVQVAR